MFKIPASHCARHPSKYKLKLASFSQGAPEMAQLSAAKIFSVGFHRVGSRSLNIYLRLLGYRAIHWPSVVHGVDFQARISPLVDDPEGVIAALQPLLEEYEAFSDIPFPGLYRELAARYPNARFILLTRDLEMWFTSLASIWRLEAGPHILTPFERILYRHYLPGKTQATQADRVQFIEAHRQHVATCLKDLAGRPLLLAELSDPKLGNLIADFLGRRAWPFPHVSDGHGEALPMWVRFAVAARAAQGYLFGGWSRVAGSR